MLSEQAIGEVLSARFPDYGFYGEETGRHAMDARNVWLVDPIDGTKSFVRDCPFFSTQIALQRAGRTGIGRFERIGIWQNWRGPKREPEHSWMANPRGSQAAWTRSRMRITVHGEYEDAGGVARRLVALLVRWCRAGQSVARLRRFPALPSTRARRARCRDRVGVVNIPGHRSAGGHRTRGGRLFSPISPGGEVGLHTTTVLATNGALHAPLLEAMRQ